MAPAIPLAINVGAAIFAAGKAGIVAKIAVLAVASMVSQKMQQRAASRGLADQKAGQKVLVRSGNEPQRVIYGEDLVSGALVYAASTGTDNKYIHLFIALAGHEVDSIGDIYFGDTISTDTKYKTIPQVPTFTIVVSGAYTTPGNLSVTIDGNGISTAAVNDTTEVNAENIKDDINAEGLTGISATRSGSTVTITGNTGVEMTVTATGASTGFTLTETETQEELGFAYRITKYTGADSQTADADAVSELTDWTTDHRLRGIAYIYVRLEFERETWQGLPEIRAKVRGKKVYDPRTEVTAWSDNAALCARDYLSSDYGLEIGSADLPDAVWNAAANTCDETVSISAEETNSRYTLNGVISLDEQPIDIIEKMKSACMGELIHSAGSYLFYPAQYNTPSFSIGEGDIRGPMRCQPKASRHDLFNGVRGLYVEPNDLYNATDYPVVTSSTFETADGSQQILADLEVPFTHHAMDAQRLAALMLEKSRQSLVVELPVKLMALQVVCWETIKLTISDMGWTDKIFRIIDFRISLSGDDQGIDLVLQEEVSDSYSWSYTDATSVASVTPPTIANPGRLVPGTDSNNLVQLDGSSALPAVDGGNLSNVAVPGDIGVTVQEYFTDEADISTGVTDSGGVGYKLLRVPNAITIT